MRNIKFLILSFLLALGFSACENVDFGDTNTNTNGPSNPDPQTLLTAAMLNYSTVTGREYLIRPTLYVQYQTQNVYTQEMRYNEAASFWGNYYVNELSELQEVINFLNNPDNITASVLSKGAVENQLGVSMIFKSVIMKRVTDTFGDVPYSESLLGNDNVMPAYDSQQSIYEGLINDVKAARDMMDEDALGPVGDIVYGGDVAKWKKFANSFLLQLSLQLSKRYPSSSGYAANEFNDALDDSAGVIESVDDEAWFTFYDITAQRNPWVANRSADYHLSREFTDALHGTVSSYNRTSNHTADYRLAVYSTSYGANGRPYGYAATQSGTAQMDKYHYWNNTGSLPLLTASYTYLNRADAANLGWTEENVDEMLYDGIYTSFESLEVYKVNGGETETELDPTDLTDYAPVYAAARIADCLVFGYNRVIAEEKWVSLFPSGFDAWSEWRRSGYPALLPATDYLNNGTIPRRYIYPSEEAGINAANYASGVATLNPGSDHNYSRVWWDVDND